MSDLSRAKQELLANGYTCVLCKGDEIYTSNDRGVKPLVALCESGVDFGGFSASDKVVGRATAFLYVLLGVKEVYALVISKSALKVLNERRICVDYGTLVDHIINRKGDGICPFEEAVLNINDKNEAYAIILKKMREMGISL